MTYLLCCGDRNWTDREVIEATLIVHLQPGDVVVQGGNGYLRNDRPARDLLGLELCVRGADALAYQAARTLGRSTKTEWADWAAYGLRAGPVRNKAMLDLGPRAVLAFHNDLARSKGTKNMLKQAIKAGIRCYLINDLTYCVEVTPAHLK